jgi:hypothetical protein
MWIIKVPIMATVIVALGLAGFGLAPMVAPATEKAWTTKDDLTPATFAKLQALIKPQDHEWRHLRVHWLSDGATALKRAAAEDKPIIFANLGGAGYNSPWGVC